MIDAVLRVRRYLAPNSKGKPKCSEEVLKMGETSEGRCWAL